MEGITRAPDTGSKPLWLVTATQFDTWRRSLPAPAGAWLRDSGFAGEAQRLVPLPGADGSLAGAVLGLGGLEGAEAITPWSTAGLPEKLPAGRWHIETPLSPAAATRALLGWALGRYRFDRYRKPSDPASRTSTLAAPPGADLDYVERTAAADAMARDLINAPAADMGPEQLAAAMAGLATRHGARFRQVVGDELLDERLAAIHAVGRAGPQAPRLLDLEWGGPGQPRVTLVGKGVCFDTGGLDIKNPQGMALMKKDMGGAACVLGLAHMVMDARLPVRLRVLVPAVENSIDARAYRPGDVLTTRKGLTVEVGNTDAEGRLVLADALAVADEESPELLVDLATLTGAARVALGPDLPALFCDDESLAAGIEAAGRDESDPLWRLPLWTPYDDELASKIADLSNVASNAFAGAIMGALFLRRFVSGTTRWAHIDLYGWNPRERPGRPVGGSAQAMRALFRLLARRYGANGDA